MEYWEPIDDDSDWEDDGGLEDILSADLSAIAKETQRSLDEILQMEYEIIDECTDLDAAAWISIYAAKYREIVTRDPSLTKSQIKRELYLK